MGWDGWKEGWVRVLLICSLFDVRCYFCVVFFCCNPPLSLFPPHVVVLSPHSSSPSRLVHSSSFFLPSSLQSMMSPSPPSSPSLRCLCLCLCALPSSVTPFCPSLHSRFVIPPCCIFLNTVFASTYLLPLTFPFSS